LFRRGLLQSLLDGDMAFWYRTFDKTITAFDAQVFIRQSHRSDDAEEKSPPQFATDAATKFRYEAKQFTQALERMNTMSETGRPKAQTPLPIIINRVVRNYVIAKTEGKPGLSLAKYRDEKEGVKWDDVPKELLDAFNAAKQKLALSLFLEFRSRKEQALVDHFAATFFSVTQRLAESDRLDLASVLVNAARI
jgi:CRISPR-associated protein Cmx8